MPIDLPERPKVALIHDWLVTYRGGEKVLEAIAELFPEAPIFTLFHTPNRSGATLAKHPTHASFLNAVPGAHKIYRHLLPLMPMAIESFDLKGFDLVISSSHCVAKGVIVDPSALHICYCHTPMRYAWDKAGEYFAGWKKALVFPFLHYLRQWDVTSSARVDYFLANSRWIGERIEKYYRRPSSVVYPFVDAGNFSLAAQTAGDYYLIVAGFAPYKRIDLAIEACERLGRKLIIVGEGQDERRLKSLAGSHTTFLGRVDGSKLNDLYAGAKVFLFPGEEDFGIAPLEAMACGRPVIAYGRGGVVETVIDGKTGTFFAEPNVESLAEAIERFERTPGAFDPVACRKRALEFDRARFQSSFRSSVERLWLEHLATKPSPRVYRSPESPSLPV
jgi:glycosyltransferase involved in cell wall biosynthesis